MSDMREKVKEYIEELEAQIKLHEGWLERYQNNADIEKVYSVKGYLIALIEVKNDLQSRLDEII